MIWSITKIDRVKPICMFDVSKDEELQESSNWKNTQTLLKEIHKRKGLKDFFLDYQLQNIKAYQFLKMNEERNNEKLHH